jgi:hypothetical protein
MAVLVLLLLKEGMNEKRLDARLLPSLLVFLRLKEKEVRLESVERRGSTSIGIGFMLTGGWDGRADFSLGVSGFSASFLPPNNDPRLPKSSPNVLDRLWPLLLEALLFGSFKYWSELLKS